MPATPAAPPTLATPQCGLQLPPPCTCLQHHCGPSKQLGHKVVEGPRLGQVEHAPAGRRGGRSRLSHDTAGQGQAGVQGSSSRKEDAHCAPGCSLSARLPVPAPQQPGSPPQPHLKTPRAPGSRAARAISPPSHSSARSGRTGYTRRSWRATFPSRKANRACRQAGGGGPPARMGSACQMQSLLPPPLEGAADSCTDAGMQHQCNRQLRLPRQRERFRAPPTPCTHPADAVDDKGGGGAGGGGRLWRAVPLHNLPRAVDQDEAIHEAGVVCRHGGRDEAADAVARHHHGAARHLQHKVSQEVAPQVLQAGQQGKRGGRRAAR